MGAEEKSDSITARYLIVDIEKDSLTEDDLRGYFEAFGELEEVAIKEMGGELMGSVKFSTPTVEQKDAMLGDQHEINGLPLTVSTWKLQKSSRKKSGTQKAPTEPKEIGARPGDWECPGCGANVFASKDACFKCGATREGSQARAVERSKGRASKGGGRSSPYAEHGGCKGGKPGAYGGCAPGVSIMPTRRSAYGGAMERVGYGGNPERGYGGCGGGYGPPAGKGYDHLFGGKGCGYSACGKGYGQPHGAYGYPACGKGYGGGYGPPVMYGGFDPYTGYGPAQGYACGGKGAAGPYGMGAYGAGCYGMGGCGDMRQAAGGRADRSAKGGKRGQGTNGPETKVHEDSIASRYQLGDLHADTSEQDLRDYFGVFGDIELVSVRVLSGGGHAGSVKFSEPYAELKATMLNQTHAIHDQPITVMTHKMTKRSKEKHKKDGAQAGE